MALIGGIAAVVICLLITGWHMVNRQPPNPPLAVVIPAQPMDFNVPPKNAGLALGHDNMPFATSLNKKPVPAVKPKSLEEIMDEKEKQEHAWADAQPAPLSSEQTTQHNTSQNPYQQAEHACEEDVTLGIMEGGGPVNTAQEALNDAESLDNDADDIENQIPNLSPGRQPYWTEEEAKIRRKAQARREEAQALPQRHEFGSP